MPAFSSSLPSSSIKIRSAFWIMGIRWVMIKVVRFLMSSSNAWRISFSVSASTLAVESSSIRMLGLTSSVRAIEKPLFLSSGEGIAALAYPGIVTVR